MKTRWIIEKMSLLPRWTSSLSYSFKTLASPNPSLSRTPCFVLNHVDLSTLLSTCGREGHLRLGSSLHAAIIKIPEFIDPGGSRTVLVVWNSLLSMYSKCGQLSDADKLFDNMPVRDAVSWNSIISGFLRNGELEIGFEYFKRMHNSGIYRFDEATLTTILSTFDGPNFIRFAKTIHGLVFLTGFETEITVGNALITSYFKCKCSVSGRQVFDEMMEKNVITWTAAISGLANNEWYEESLKLFIKMRNGTVNPNSLTYLSSLLACSGLQSQKEGSQIHGLLWKLGIQSDLCVESALMDMYCKCKNMEDAFKLFEWAEVFDEVSMTVILVGFAQNGFQVEAIQIFSRIVKSGIEIDVNIVSAILGLFGTDTCLGLGRQIHSLAIKKNFVSNIFVSNGLINMYSKCGDLDESEKIFDKIPQKNQISWNSMIAAFARHGAVSRALDLYEEMKFHGVEPSDVTFLSLLHVCAHVGLVEKGMEFFQSMSKIHNIVPRMEHYACVVDLLGRAGLLNEAKDFIEGMPVKPGPLVWQALLGACSFHRESDIGKYAAEELSSADPNSHSPYILMANIYSHEGRWRERARTIRRMREMGVGSKETGMSWIEIKKEVHGFVVGDGMHWRGEAIYGVLLGLFGHMMDEGYVPDKRFLLCYYLDSDEEEEEEALKAS